MEQGPNRAALWLALAAALILATVGALVAGLALDVYVLVYWGVLSAYLGLSWAMPGTLVWAGTRDLMRARGQSDANGPAVAAGIVSGATLVVLVSAILVAASAGKAIESGASTTSTTATEAETTAVGLARHEAGRTGVVHDVTCSDLEDVTMCAVALAGPVCQLWLVNGDEASPVGPPVAGGAVSRTETGLRCEG